MDQLIMQKHFQTDTEIIKSNDLLLNTRHWEVTKCEFPIFVMTMLHPKSQKKYGFYFNCDYYPISMLIVDPVNLVPLTGCLVGGNFLPNHPITHLPFLCIPGLREYHTHSSHVNEKQWAFPDYKFRLPQLIDNVYTHFISSMG